MCSLVSLYQNWKIRTLVWFLVRPTYQTYVFLRYFNILPRQNICLLYVVLNTMCCGYSYFVMWFYVIKIYRKNFWIYTWQSQKHLIRCNHDNKLNKSQVKKTCEKIWIWYWQSNKLVIRYNHTKQKGGSYQLKKSYIINKIGFVIGLLRNGNIDKAINELLNLKSYLEN